MNQAIDTGQVFSFSRFRTLIALHWGGHKKLYLLSLPAMAGLLAVWYGFVLFMDKFNPLDEGIQAFTFYWGIAVVGCLYSSTIFAEFGSKARGIAWLGVPASTLEKLLCGWFFSAVVVFVGFTLVYYVVDVPLVKIGNGLIVKQHRMYPGGFPIGQNGVWNVLKGLPNEEVDNRYHVFLLLYVTLQGLFALGSVYFERYAFIKTMVAFMVFLLAFMVLEKQIMAVIPPRGWVRFPPFQDWVTNSDSLRVREVRVSTWITGPLMLLVLLGIPPVIWVITYFRIKEKEV